MKIVLAIGLAALLAVMATSAAISSGTVSLGKPKWYSNSEKMTDSIANAAQSAVPVPLTALTTGGFLERKNLAERLSRFSKQSKIGYLYLMSFGKFVGYYVVRGKLSSVNSQMTVTHQTWSGEGADTVVDSMGDDGSFGPNEGGDQGVFFFTATDVMVETTLDWVYSDQPLRIDVPNLLKGKR